MTTSGPTAADSKLLLSKVYVTDAVVQSCLAHAFTSEKEEIMGVLLGSVEVVRTAPPSKVARIWASHIMHRSVRRSDRVEVPAEALITASDTAEAMSAKTGVQTRVVGWYHSHPQFPPIPSSVDLNSQKTYQQMESGWVGLIFGVFHADSSSRNACSVHCFQTASDNSHLRVPLQVCTAPQLGLPLAPYPVDHEVLTMLGEELDMAVEGVRQRTGGDAAAMEAARGLRTAQAFTLERVVGDPTAKHLEWCSIPQLEAEVARLEKELKGLS